MTKDLIVAEPERVVSVARTRVATIFPNCYRTRRGFHFRKGAGYAERS
jgi:hypothetical protein